MPSLVIKAGTEALATVEGVKRNCQITKPKLLKNISGLKVKGDFVAYASPDSTYAVTRKFMDAAKKEILIGIYDFSAQYIKEILLNARRRGVKVSLMLDMDGKAEHSIVKELKKNGCKTVPAPSCASQHIAYFPCCHEKVIVIDNEWVLVQSGNYSTTSIPFNEIDGGDPNRFVKGNRDMGVAVRSKSLCDFFTKVLRSDMKLELDAEGIEALMAPPDSVDIVERVPPLIPTQLFRSKQFKPTKAIDVMPVLSPDNYMEVITELLASATESIYIENQYIKSTQSEIAKLLKAIKKAKDNNPGLDVRIVLGKLFDKDKVPAEKVNIANLKAKYDLLLGKHIRYIDTTRFVHCHNKMIVVDGKISVISSQNWSNSAVSKNREAGLVIDYPALAKYYTEIFESDWKTASKRIPLTGPESITPEALLRGNYIQVVAADYEIV